MTHDRAPHWIGANRNKPMFAPCGLCGHSRKLSETHIPPQVAGNTGRRYREQVREKVRRPGTLKDGGMWVYGLCSDCNSEAGGRYDNSYAMFAEAMRPFVMGTNELLLPARTTVPVKAVAPGRVARSVLYSMFGLWLRLRHYAPDLARDLKERRHPTQLPPQYRLRLAGYRGRPVLEALTFAADVMRMTDKPYNVVGAFYSEPFAWALTHEDDELFDHLGWGDATSWVRFNPDAGRLDLRDVLDRFVIVNRPADTFGMDGMELNSDETLLLRGM